MGNARPVWKRPIWKDTLMYDYNWEVKAGGCEAGRRLAYDLLKATMAIVPFYDQAVEIDGELYVDGGIANPVPVRSAIEDGCTHILVQLT